MRRCASKILNEIAFNSEKNNTHRGIVVCRISAQVRIYDVCVFKSIRKKQITRGAALLLQ